MTQVYLEADGDRYTIDCREHATGSPEVCAAISAIVFTVAGWLENEPEGVEVLTERLEMGRAHIEFTGGETARAVFDAAAIGLLQIEQAHGEYICVDTKEI